jgi:hypothetical protein
MRVRHKHAREFVPNPYPAADLYPTLLLAEVFIRKGLNLSVLPPFPNRETCQVQRHIQVGEYTCHEPAQPLPLRPEYSA